MGLLHIIGVHSLDTVSNHASFSARCTGMTGMSIMVYLTLAIVIYERLLREFVLPWAFSWFWSDLSPEKKCKMIGCFVALNIRLAMLIALLPSFVTNFGLNGLVRTMPLSPL
jgi:hypothetical protein